MRTSKLAWFVLSLCGASFCSAQFQLTPQQQARRDSIRKLSEIDHKEMMDQLGITSIRPGVSGDSKAAHAANYNKAKPNPYPGNLWSSPKIYSGRYVVR